MIDETIKTNIGQADGEKSAKDKLTEQLQQGVKSVTDSENFKNYLKTSGRLIYNNYSFNNTLLVWLQKPDASYIMDCEVWKELGRNVRQGAAGAKILMPVMASEKEKGGLVEQIKSNLNAELSRDPAAAQAYYRFGQSNMEFTRNRANGLIGLKIDGAEKAVFKSDAELKKFVDKAVLGKVPMYFTVGTVFDAKDVIIPEHLWLKRGFTEDEVVTDEKGNPVKNGRGETKIINTPERQARFVDNIDLEITAQDPGKMKVLFDACAAVCRNRGVPVLESNADEDEAIKSGAEGYFIKSDDKYPNGLIVLNGELEITKKCSVLLHEMAHADMHPEIEKLASEMGEDKVTKPMKELQAQAVSYAVGSKFGIEDTSFSFDYMAVYTKGFEMQDLHKSLDVIHREIKSMFSDLKAELDTAGYNLDLTEKPAAMIEKDTIKTITQNNLNYALKQENVCARAIGELPTLIAQHKNSPEILAILEKIKKNADIQQDNIDIIKNNIAGLNGATTREEQNGYVDKLNNAYKRINVCANAHERLSEQFVSKNRELRGELKDKFDKDPLKTIKNLNKNGAYPRIADLSESQLAYIAASKYIALEYSKLLRDKNNAGEFADKICDRAAVIADYASENGTFVEIASCEDFLDKPVFANGTICHPKVAEQIVHQAEIQVQGIKKEFADRGEYFPYIRCDVTVYSPVPGYGLTALRTKIDIGDGEQQGLKDHLTACNADGTVKDEILHKFEEALQEKSFEDKISTPHVRSGEDFSEKNAEAPQSDHSMSGNDWKKEINAAKSAANTERERQQDNTARTRQERR